jgi:type II secretory ATPase GspE/PulE/Tfp pilus assembly ATPase PilB-like protein
MAADAVTSVHAMLRDAVACRASDVHLEPTADGYEIRFRTDGLLETRQRVAAELGRSMALRLMVMAKLLTYRLDVPQEGRCHWSDDASAPGPLDLRVSVIPTTHGLRVAVRLPAELVQPRSLDALDLPADVLASLHRFADADAGMLLVVGPAGSGKTTTLYALLEHIAATGRGLSVISIEDPVERQLRGVTQIEVTPFGEMTCERVLRSVLRQDPQVLMLGEIRDADTAALAVNAALTGHRLLCTLHASDPVAALVRLMEMGLDRYKLAASVWGVLSQRLLRRRAPGGGYQGRVPAAEIAVMDEPLRSAVLRGDVAAMRDAVRRRRGQVTIRRVADDLVGRGVTDEDEVFRVLGREDA